MHDGYTDCHARNCAVKAGCLKVGYTESHKGVIHMSKRASLPQVADAATLRRVAIEAERSEPPAIVRRDRKTVMINVKVSEDLAIALAERAETEGITQKQIITRALAAAGLPVDPLDLQDRTSRRRRAA
jgi:hypothetical protein